MIKVTLHAGGVAGASLFNMLGKLDFGYEKLDAVADYKAELFACGVGAYPMAFIKDYPRWSTSIWDPRGPHRLPVALPPRRAP
jgi:hypothetical protein